MKKVYRKLTKDQIERGVVFSSTLSTAQKEQPSDTVHEIMQNDTEREQKKARLLNDSFFEDSPFTYNIIRR